MQSCHADGTRSLTERVANALLIHAARSAGSRIELRRGAGVVALHEGGRDTLLGPPELLALLDGFGGLDGSPIPTDLVKAVGKHLTAMAQMPFYARQGRFEIQLGLTHDSAPHACFAVARGRQGIVVEVTRALAP